MSESFYRIHCWLHNRKGPSFAIELRGTNDHFAGVRQDEAGTPIASIREGRVDRSVKFREFSVPTEVVAQLLANLSSSALPVLPRITGGFDGANYHVQIWNGESLAHFSWWLDCPEPWEPIEAFWKHIVELSRS